MRSAQVIQLLLLVPSLAWGQTTDISGTWRGQANGPGGQSVPLMLTLRAEGGKLTGAFTGPPPDTAKPIVDGAINGDHLTFRVLGGGDPTEAPREFRFDATVSGGRMRGTVSNPRGMQIEFALEKDTSTGAAPEGGQPLHVGAAPGSPAAGVATPPVLTGPDPAPQPAVEAILGALDDHEVVALGSIAHGTLDMDHLVLDLLRDPRLPGKVQDIAVECGNALYQPLLDRYIAGGAVSLADVRQVWRNTSQPMECPFSLFYNALFPLVRRINQLLPAGSRLRVLACDPPIDWSRVHRPEDLHGLMGRDESIASVIENEVLARHRKALMLFGINHIRHGVGAVGIYESRFPGVTLVVAEHHGFGEGTPFARYNDTLEQRMSRWPVPSMISLRGTWLNDLPAGYFDPEDAVGTLHGYPGVDAYVYLGPRDLLLMEPAPAASVLDTAYIAELRRRAASSDGLGGPADPATIVRREMDASVFLQDTVPGVTPVRTMQRHP